MKNDEIDGMKRLQWKVTPKVFIDDVEAIYDTEFHLQTRNIRYQNFPSDPKAQRIRRRQEKWKWLFLNHGNWPKIIDILQEANVQFKKLNRIRQHVQLNANQVRQFGII